jgi:hypothetical protein
MPHLTRRSFLSRCAVATAAATLPSFYIRAEDKAGTSLPVIGSGEHTYTCVHDWLRPPEGMVWGDTHGLCQDSAGNIYVGHTVGKSSMRSEAVVVFDADGKFVRAFGEDFRGGAHGLDVRREPDGEFLYHCDINRCRTVKTTLTGEVVWTRGYPRDVPAYGAEPINFVPTNIAFAPNGDYYVGDGYGSNHVLHYTREGKFVREIGRPGPRAPGAAQGDGELKEPHGLWVDTRGSEPVLVICDRGNRRLQIFTLDGQHLRTVKQDQLRMPCHLNLRGDLMICPDLDSQVCLLDRDYKVVAQLGDGQANNGRLGSRRSQARSAFTPGQFILPHDAIFLQNGDILVAEWVTIGRITLLKRTS